ncbi:hypothetical protein D3C86_2037820 [compost metagenome]
MFDGPVFSGSVHSLENHQEAVPVVCVHHALQLIELFGRFFLHGLVLGLVGIDIFELRFSFSDVKFLATVVAIIIRVKVRHVRTI